MKMITGFLAPTSGKIEVCGMNVAEQPMEIRKKIGYLPESNPQYYEMYVREYLAFLAHLHQLGEQSKARIEEMVSITGLSREAHKKIGALSKGYKQRVGLAQAMLHDPEVLILDEPTSAMDSWAEAEWMSRFRELVAGRTAIMITHRFTTAMQADQIYVMDCGKIVESGTHQQLLSLGGLYAQSWKQQMKDVNL
jgi:ABC-2 type transport system ATP-binding protein